MNILIIGASAAGLKAACRARRILPKAKVKVIDEGKYISYAACGLPYYLSGDIENFRSLTTTIYDVVKTPEFFTETKDIEVLTGIRTENIDAEKKVINCRILESGETVKYPYDELVLAVGKSPIVPGINGTQLPGVYTFTRPDDAMELRRDAEARKIDKVAIIGAGFIGCELCEAFSALWGIETTLIEPQFQVLPGMLDAELARIVELELKRQDIELHLNCRPTEIVGEASKLKAVYNGGEFDGFDRVIIAAGVKPRNEIAANVGIELGSIGGIKVDAQMRTNIPHIYAAGDCVEIVNSVSGEHCFMPQGSLANRMGRVVGNVIGGRDDSIGSVVGASCLKVFDMNIASVGLTSVSAERAGFKTGASWGLFNDKAHYYPESNLVSVKMVFEKETQRVLGVQAVGKGDVVRRIDAVSNLVREGSLLRQVMDFEQAYAPPYGEVLDPLHYLAFTSISSIEEGIEPFPPLELEQRAADSIVLDVREPVEVKDKPFTLLCKSLLTIPFTKIRSRLAEIPRSESLIVVCPRGTRSSETVGILMENGFTGVRYLGGGLAFFQG